MAFAPMPMFATYGLLTALMIVLALVASLFVLPSLLVVVTPGGRHRASRVPGARVVDLRDADRGALHVGLARDLSDGTVDHFGGNAILSWSVPGVPRVPDVLGWWSTVGG